MAVVLIRHTPVAGAAGLCYGATDLPLAATAERDIAAVLGRLAPVQSVVSSPAARCRRLAEAIVARDRCALQFEPALRELDFGDWEGRRWEAIARAQSDPWAEDPWNRAPPGGEREADLWCRVQRWLLEGCRGAGRVAIVAHGGPLRLLRCHFEGQPLAARFTLSMAPGEVVEVSASRRAAPPWPAGRGSA